MKPNQRDFNILKMTAMFGCLLGSQISKLFSLHPKICQRKLRKLFNADYLQRMILPTLNNGRSPYLYYLGNKGASILDLSVTRPRVNSCLSHLMKNSDLLIQVLLSFADSEIECEILPEHIIRKSSQNLIPDGSFMLRKHDRKALFLLENCGGTEILRSPTFYEDIETKIIRYVELFENDIQFYERFYESKLNRFRLLFITNSHQRLQLTKDIILKHDRHGFVWICTLNEFNKKGVSGNIWQVPFLNKYNLSII